MKNGCCCFIYRDSHMYLSVEMLFMVFNKSIEKRQSWVFLREMGNCLIDGGR